MAYIQCASSFFSIRKDVFRELAIELFRARVRIGGLRQASGTKHTSQPFNLQAPICILPSFRPCGNRSACAERNPSSSFVTLSAEDGANALCLLSRFTRKRACQRNGGYVTCWPMCFPRIVGEVFLNDANDSDRAH